MASTTGPKLDAGRRAVERLMDDACVITRPPLDGTGTLNTQTGNVETASDTMIYNAASTGEDGRSLADADVQGGMCMVSSFGERQPSWRSEGGAIVLNENMALKIPVDAPLVKKGDEVWITSSRRDPQLVNNRYRIEAIVEKTFAISRRLIMVPV